MKAEKEERRERGRGRKILVKGNSEFLLSGFLKSCKYSIEYQTTERKSLGWKSPFFFFLLFMDNLPPRLVVIFCFYYLLFLIFMLFVIFMQFHTIEFGT